jgi:hypothetical protein
MVGQKEAARRAEDLNTIFGTASTRDPDNHLTSRKVSTPSYPAREADRHPAGGHERLPLPRARTRRPTRRPRIQTGKTFSDERMNSRPNSPSSRTRRRWRRRSRTSRRRVDHARHAARCDFEFKQKLSPLYAGPRARRSKRCDTRQGLDDPERAPDAGGGPTTKYDERLRYEPASSSRWGSPLLPDRRRLHQPGEGPRHPRRPRSRLPRPVASSRGRPHHGPDPIEHTRLFERFLNPERRSMPDIDVDFASSAATR